MRITGAARVAAVMGWPVRHSLSPALHGFWFERYGIDGVYVPLAVRPEHAEAAIRTLPRLGLLGANVTMPHKEAAFRAVDVPDASAVRTGVVNTVTVHDGVLHGASTDGTGFVANLRAKAPGWRPADGPAVLVGCGGAAKAVAIALLDLGVSALRLANRTGARAEALAGELEVLFPAREIVAVAWDERAAALAGAGLLVQATALGMAGQPPLHLALDELPPAAPVAELVYAPLVTDLLARARLRGQPVVDGLGMLLHQAVPGFRHWGGVEPAVDARTRQVVLDVLARRDR